MNITAMEALVKNFRMRLDGVLQLITAQLLASHAGFKFHIGNSSNSVFPLRAYLTILRSNEGDELSITVDISILEDGLLIDSDVVGEEGVIVADGPSLKLYDDLSEPAIQMKIDEWFESFDHFLVENSDNIETAIKSLDSKPS